MQDPGEIRVWPGTIFETQDRQSLTIKLGQIHGEAWKDFIQRVDDIANYAISKSPKSEPSVINYDDTSKYKKIGENAYELITPDHQPTEEIASDRDTHFAGSAEILWNQLHLLYSASTFSEADIDKYEKRDIEIIAQYAYDLAEHVKKFCDEQSSEINDVIFEDIPDIPTWPPSD